MLGGRSFEEWVRLYERSHQHPGNRACHLIGIPLIAGSLPLFLLLFWKLSLWPIPVALFVVGWIFQFVGHALEGEPPEFFSDWRFLLVGLRWWFAKVSGRLS
ncbi:MAG: DUF962 domain-containing protein [Acidobacteriota bacterium]